mmetsp:Transcript_10094/g.22343  ORF Transcript_10094/g.22343 Transcript_10094/m.22343 type:complete len:601 (-) Transcript_10094:54-1856(-)
MMAREGDEFDLYDVLNLQQDATPDDVKFAFKEMARLYHPDKQRQAGPSSGSGAEEAFLRAHLAYRVLGDDVMRSFYDKYGLAGVRLADNLSDDEEEGNRQNQQLSLHEDRLEELEQRVRGLMRRREELKTQRLLGVSGTFTLAAVSAPGPHGARLRRRYALQYCATSQTVQISLTDQTKLVVGCSSHVQSTNGIGASKLMFALTSQLNRRTTVRAGANVTGSSPELDLSLVRAVNDRCQVQQRLVTNRDGITMAYSIFPWITKALRGSITASLGSDAGLQLGLNSKRTAGGYSAKAFLNVQGGGGEIGFTAKYKKPKKFSCKIQPALSTRGWSVEVTCTRLLGVDRLTKLYWVLRIRRRSALIRLGLARSGLRFSFPLELWPETMGPVGVLDQAIFSLLYSLPPLCCRFGWLAYLSWSRRRAAKASKKTTAAASSSAAQQADGGAQEEGEEEDAAASAQNEQELARRTAAAEQRALLAGEAAKRRSTEAACNGLEIVRAFYGHPDAVRETSLPAGREDVIDVTDCLMAKVRNSSLQISSAPKSTLLGFYYASERPGDPGLSSSSAPPPAPTVLPILHVVYKFGGVEHSRSYQDTESFILP